MHFLPHERVAARFASARISKPETATYARCRSFFVPNRGKKYHLLHHEILAGNPLSFCGSTCEAQ